MQLESDHPATQLSRAIAECDVRLLEHAKNTHKSRKQEVDLKQQRVGDVALQNQGLLKEVGRLRDAMLPSDTDMHDIQPASNVDEFTTNNFVLYKLHIASTPECHNEYRGLPPSLAPYHFGDIPSFNGGDKASISFQRSYCSQSERGAASIDVRSRGSFCGVGFNRTDLVQGFPPRHVSRS